MTRCEICLREMDALAFKCNYCDGVFCTEHRLPERHDCKALDSPRLFKKHRPEKVADNDSPATVDDIDLESDLYYSEIDVEPMTVSSDQMVGSTSESPVSDSSPDVAPDGSLVYPDDESREEDVNENRDWIGFSRPVIAFAVVLVLAAALVLLIVI